MKHQFIAQTNDVITIPSNIVSAIKTENILVTVERWTGKKSKQQLGFIFAGIIKESADYWGWEEWEMKAYLYSECAKAQFVDPNGEIHEVIKPLSDRDMTEASEFIEKCIRHLAEKGFVVRLPEEYKKSIAG